MKTESSSPARSLLDALDDAESDLNEALGLLDALGVLLDNLPCYARDAHPDEIRAMNALHPTYAAARRAVHRMIAVIEGKN
jgi:hypothetical protein